MKRKNLFTATEKMRRIFCRIFPVVILLGAFTLSCADPWKENVPDFEVCYMEELPAGSGTVENRNFLMWWTLLGVLPPEKAAFPPEKEAVLTGRENAPYGGRYYHYFFQKEKSPALAPGVVHFSPLFRKHASYRKKGIFYGCISVRMNRTLKEAVMIAEGKGDLKIWVNGLPRLEYVSGTPPGKARNILLRSGYNRIVVRYTDPEKFDPENRQFSLRFTGKEGNPMFVR
ncbi:MAG: hypothetical protein J6S58_02850 [Lentisphaeria bacterium]|nr:hypothetical protein [Lentisphaeria bacterium]